LLSPLFILFFVDINKCIKSCFFETCDLCISVFAIRERSGHDTIEYLLLLRRFRLWLCFLLQTEVFRNPQRMSFANLPQVRLELKEVRILLCIDKAILSKYGAHFRFPQDMEVCLLLPAVAESAEYLHDFAVDGVL